MNKLINKMEKLRVAMLDMADTLKEAGYGHQATEMKGAAKVLEGWIEEISKEKSL